MTSTNELKELIEFFSPLNVIELDNKFIISMPDKYKRASEKGLDKWEVEKKEFENICLKIDEYLKVDQRKTKETALYNGNSYSQLSFRN